MIITETKVLALLAKHRINYVLREHQPIYTVAEGKALGLPNVEAAAKSLLVTADKHAHFYLVVLPLDKRLDLQKLRAALSSRRLTMATAEELQKLLALTPGAVTPLALPCDEHKQVHTIVDEDLRDNTIALPLLCNTKTIWLSCHKLVKALQEMGHPIAYLPL